MTYHQRKCCLYKAFHFTRYMLPVNFYEFITFAKCHAVLVLMSDGWPNFPKNFHPLMCHSCNYFKVKPGSAMVVSVYRVMRVPVSAGMPCALSVNVACGSMAAGKQFLSFQITSPKGRKYEISQNSILSSKVVEFLKRRLRILDFW